MTNSGDGPLSLPPRRVLLVHPSPDLYGSDRVLLESVTAFVAAGTQVVVALPGRGELSAHLQERGATVEVCPMPVVRKSALKPRGFLGLTWDFLSSLRPARRLLRQFRPDLLYVNTVTIPSWLLLGRLGRVPVLCHVHEAEGSQRLLLLRLLYAPLLLAHSLIVNSTFALDVLTRAWPRLRSRAEVVYNGVPGPAEVGAPRSRPEPIRLLFLGRLSPRKGPQVAIEAFQILRARGRDVELSLLGAVFPGYEWFETELRERAAAITGDAPGVRFLGFQPDIWPVLAAHDIVLVPSTVDEPFGNTAVEAMLANRPLVVSETSGLLEAARDFRTARFVAPSDASELADVVDSLVIDWADVRQLGEADRADALRRFSPTRYQADILKAGTSTRFRAHRNVY